VRHPAPREHVDRIGKHVEPFFHHQSAKEGDHRDIVGNVERTAPAHVAATRVEHVLFDTAGPDTDVVIHPLVAQHLREAFRRRDQRIALTIKLAQPGDNHRFEERQVVIAKIGLETRVDRTGDRQPAPPRPSRGLPRHAIGA